MKDQKHNMNPHREARMAMWLFSSDYANSGKGSIDYWNSLPEMDKNMCRNAVKEILKCEHEENEENKK